MKCLNILAMIVLGMIAFAESRRRRRSRVGELCSDSSKCSGDTPKCCDDTDEEGGHCFADCEGKGPEIPAEARRRRRY